MHVEKQNESFVFFFFQEVEKVAIIKKSNMVGNYEFCLIFSSPNSFFPFVFIGVLFSFFLLRHPNLTCRECVQHGVSLFGNSWDLDCKYCCCIEVQHIS